MSTNALAFYLESPMQSWGVASRYQQRATEAFPTKSGILGMLAAAIGIDKETENEADQLAPLASLRFSVFQIKPALVQRLTDYHTVGGGWKELYDIDPKSIYKLSVPSKAKDGAMFGTVQTYRTYLTDAQFVAILEGDETVLTQCQAALLNPVWGIWFGRKCCIPSSPLLPTIGSDKESAVQTLLAHLAKNSGKEFEINLLTAPGQLEQSGEGAGYPSDQPISFKSRTFKSRPVRRNISR